MKKFFQLLALSLFWAISSGCVSMQEYQDVVVENSQLKKERGTFRNTLLKIQRDKNWMAKKNKKLAKENTNLKGEVTGLKKTLQNTQKRYDGIFKNKLTNFAKLDGLSKLGKEFEINPKTGGIVLEGDIFFNPGSSSLRGQGKTILRKLMRKLAAPPYNAYQIEVAGHTDSDPLKRTKRKYKDNWWLSCARAHSVLKYVVKQGVPQSRLFISGYSFFKPRTSVRTRRGKKQNRRVEIVLHQPSTKIAKKF